MFHLNPQSIWIYLCCSCMSSVLEYPCHIMIFILHCKNTVYKQWLADNHNSYAKNQRGTQGPPFCVALAYHHPTSTSQRDARCPRQQTLGLCKSSAVPSCPAVLLVAAFAVKDCIPRVPNIAQQKRFLCDLSVTEASPQIMRPLLGVSFFWCSLRCFVNLCDICVSVWWFFTCFLWCLKRPL